MSPEWSNECYEHQLFNFIESDMSFLLLLHQKPDELAAVHSQP